MKSKKLTILFTLFVAFILCVFGVSFFAFADGNKSYKWNEIELESEYFVGDELVIPTSIITVDGNEHYANFFLQFPDGNCIFDDDNNLATSLNLNLTLPGTYQLTYFYSVNEQDVFYTKEFIVKSKLFSVSSGNSFVEYDFDKSEWQCEKQGLNLKLAAGDVFKYNRVIDFTEITSIDDILTFYVFPEVNGEIEVSGLTVMLTDAYDSNNVVEIQVKSLENVDGWLRDETYFSAAVPSVGQVTTGYAKGAIPEIQVNTQFGSGCTYFSFYGDLSGTKGKASDVSISLSFDYPSKQLFQKNRFTGTKLITDFDDSEFYSKLWSGFSKGKAFLSIKGNTFFKDYANIFITDIYGADLGEENIFIKDSSPEIEVDDNGLDLEKLSSVLGYKFPVFNAKCVDVYDGELPVYVRVYNGYYSNSKSEIEITDDGYFVADKLGLVTLEYSSKDYVGNTILKLIDIKINANSFIDIKFDGEYTTNGKQGDLIKICDYIVEGNIGKVDTDISVICGNITCEVNDGYFVADYFGNYEISINTKDIIGQQAELSYSVNIEENLNPVFNGEILIPDYFIVGKDYKLPEYFAYDYSSNKTAIKSDIYVNGTKTEILNATEEGEITIEYKATTSKGSSNKIYKRNAISAYDGKNLAIDKLFINENMISTIDNLGLNFTAEGNDANTVFINLLSSYEFSVEFAINKNADNFEFLEFILTDPLNDDKFITVSVNLLSLELYCNGNPTGIKFEYFELFNSDGKNFAKISFDARTGNIAAKNQKIAVKNFSGFTNNLLKLKVRMAGVSGDAEFSIRRICNQVIKSSVKKDNISPLVAYNGTYDIFSSLNKEITVFKAIASDVLSPIKDFGVSVKDSDGNYVSTSDGKTLLNNVDPSIDYKIILSKYGKYTIEYNANDVVGNVIPFTGQVITVVDKVAPVLDVVDIPRRAKIGSLISINNYTATDNVDSELVVNVFLTNPNSGYVTELKETQIQLNAYGTYKLSYICMDKAGNVSLVVKTIIVED